jgi:hypothetical protein
MIMLLEKMKETPFASLLLLRNISALPPRHACEMSAWKPPNEREASRLGKKKEVGLMMSARLGVLQRCPFSRGWLP